MRAPASTARRARSGALSASSSQPRRIFTVTGSGVAATTASDQLQRLVGHAHQGRAGIAVGDALGRAAHVDIDDVGASGIGDLGAALPHPLGLATGELHDMRQRAGLAELAHHLVLAGGEGVAGDHFETTRPAPKRSARRRIGASVIPPSAPKRRDCARRDQQCSTCRQNQTTPAPDLLISRKCPQNSQKSVVCNHVSRGFALHPARLLP